MTDHEQARRDIPQREVDRRTVELIVEAFDKINNALAAEKLPCFANVDEWFCRAPDMVIKALIDFEKIALLDEIPGNHDDMRVYALEEMVLDYLAVETKPGARYYDGDDLEAIGTTQEEWHSLALKRVHEKLGTRVN